MPGTFKHRLAVWALNGVAAALSGIGSTGLAVFGVASSNAVVPNLTPNFTPHQILAMLISGAAVGLFMYLKTPAGKLPSLDTDNGTTPLP